MKEKRYHSIDEIIEEIKGIPTKDLKEPREDGRNFITVDDLRAAGALDCPPAWRKSLGVEAPDLFSDLLDDDKPANSEQ